MSKSKNKEKPVEFEIENVVATVTLDITEKIDLTLLAKNYVNAEYNPERFPGLIMRLDKPKATILIFSTGKMVITGMRKAEEAKPVVEKVIKRMKKSKINVSNPQILIQNIVASGHLHKNIDLNRASIVLEAAMYEPEVFPGLIYRMRDPKTVFLIFSTGKIVCTGVKTKEVVEKAVEKLSKEVEEYGIAMDESETDLGDYEDEYDLDFI
ncbi:MAG: TATA-box-binding protein [Promethearchaeota archaeon]